VSAVVVRHALGSYPVYVEPGGLGRLGEIAERNLGRRRLALITDDTVSRLYHAWRAGGQSPWRGAGEIAAPEPDAELAVPAGESSKTRERWAELSDALLERGFGRDSGILALGGGVVGDLAGFVAATYLRGVPHLLVPTTLLAMLDASVGGKTGVDTRHGKNLIGAFHPPVAVLADPRTLLTLPDREFRAGLAEAVKHGLIADRAYFAWIGESADAIDARDLGALTMLVRRSVQIKAEIVAADEREAGRRAILNAGHTVAHALEQVSSYTLAHGEAVALGLVAECRLAEALGIAPAGLAEAVGGLLHRLGLPITLANAVPRRAVLDAMAVDKKNRARAVRFALPTRLGAMHSRDGWTVPARADALDEALAAIGVVASA